MPKPASYAEALKVVRRQRAAVDEERERSRGVNSSNPHSGKWNFHFDHDVEPDLAFAYYRRELESVL